MGRDQTRPTSARERSDRALRSLVRAVPARRRNHRVRPGRPLPPRQSAPAGSSGPVADALAFSGEGSKARDVRFEPCFAFPRPNGAQSASTPFCGRPPHDLAGTSAEACGRLAPPTTVTGTSSPGFSEGAGEPGRSAARRRVARHQPKYRSADLDRQPQHVAVTARSGAVSGAGHQAPNAAGSGTLAGRTSSVSCGSCCVVPHQCPGNSYR